MVTIVKGIHLFPSRTQKLSPSTLMVLGWRRPGRVGSRQIAKTVINFTVFFVLIYDVVLDPTQHEGVKIWLHIFLIFLTFSLKMSNSFCRRRHRDYTRIC